MSVISPRRSFVVVFLILLIACPVVFVVGVLRSVRIAWAAIRMIQ